MTRRLKGRGAVVGEGHSDFLWNGTLAAGDGATVAPAGEPDRSGANYQFHSIALSASNRIEFSTRKAWAISSPVGCVRFDAA
jgi:lysozyme family protein